MRAIKRYSLYLACLAILWAGPSPAQESSLVTAILQEAGTDLAKLSKLINEHESLLKRYPDSEFSATVMFQLAELYEQKASLSFQNKMAEYEQELERYDKGERKQEPIMPRLSLAQTIDYCYRILNEYPSVEFKDKVLYKLAMAHLQEGNLVQATSYFEKIIQNYPKSSINLESYFRIGEYHFDKHDYHDAINHYKALLGKWDNPYFDMALYKLGWSYYNISDYSNAISTFIYLIEDIEHAERVESKTIGKSKADLRSEAIHYIASCFTEYGGPEQAFEFLSPRRETSYARPVLVKMGELYRKRSFYQDAIDSYRKLLALYPNDENAPDIFDGIVLTYEADNQDDKANKVRQEAIDLFSPGGKWALNQPDGEAYTRGTQLAGTYLVYLGKTYQSEAQESGRVRDYQKAIENYKTYLEEYRHADNLDEINYYLAECYYANGEFQHAAEAYHDVTTLYDSTGYREDAAYNRILCYDQLLGSDPAVDSTLIYLEEFLGTGEILTAKLRRQSEIDLLQACNDYVRFFPDSKYTDQVLMKFGETLHELKLYKPAVQTYKAVVDRGEDGPYYLQAAMNTGQSLFEGEYYHQAELWLKKLVDSYPDSSQYVQRAKTLITSSQFKIAENLGKEGQFAESASVLKSIAQQADDETFKERALYAAAAQYQKMGKETQAALSLEELASSYPESDLAAEALQKAGSIRENNQEWTLAAADYIRLAETYPGSKFAARALKNAALCYETIKDWYAAQRLYDRFVDAYPEKTMDRIECLYKSGEMAFNAGQLDRARQKFQTTISTYQTEIETGEYLDNYFVAQAQFMIGELYFKEYAQLDLKPPLKQNLQRKIQKFNQVLNAYKQTLEYQVADWSTAASYRIGSSFEELVRAFMESPPPPGLDDEKLKLYTDKLEENAQPYKKRALQTYQRTVEQAKANQINNKWVNQSRERMRELRRELNPDTTTAQAGETTS